MNEGVVNPKSEALKGPGRGFGARDNIDPEEVRRNQTTELRRGGGRRGQGRRKRGRGGRGARRGDQQTGGERRRRGDQDLAKATRRSLGQAAEHRHSATRALRILKADRVIWLHQREVRGGRRRDFVFYSPPGAMKLHERVRGLHERVAHSVATRAQAHAKTCWAGLGVFCDFSYFFSEIYFALISYDFL